VKTTRHTHLCDTSLANAKQPTETAKHQGERQTIENEIKYPKTKSWNREQGRKARTKKTVNGTATATEENKSITQRLQLK
jgi:hypothetical protein